MITRVLFSLITAVSVVACRSSESGNRDTTAQQANATAARTTAAQVDCDSAARRIVTRLGERMRQVSLLAPDSVVKREIADAYAALASSEALATWQATPANAPGREVSNPWPARIEVRSMQADGGRCRVEGDVVYVTSTDTTTAVERRAVTIRLNPRDSLRITAYQIAGRSADQASEGAVHDGATATDNATAAANVVRHYYRDIAAHDYGRAYALWGQSGRASGKTRAEFAAGFAQTADVHVTIRGVPQLEGAAGSEYATVSVAVDGTLRNGETQHFTGTYTLRRVMVDGATPAQRAWHIFTAKLTD